MLAASAGRAQADLEERRADRARFLQGLAAALQAALGLAQAAVASEQVARHLIKTNAPEQQVYLATRQLMLAQRIANDVNRVLEGGAATAAAIDEFERQLADRVDAGYAVVGPMLEAYKAGNPPENFEASWNELRDFRMAIPDDLRALRDEAERRVSAGDEAIQLEFPDYPLLSWESD